MYKLHSPTMDENQQAKNEDTIIQTSPTVTTDPERDHMDDFAEVSQSQRRRILRKIDLHLMAPLWVVLLFGFLDRVNLGNVAVLGVMEELQLRGNDFNIAMQVFFIPYIVLEVPCNLLLKRFKPSTWVTAMSFLWGTAAMCQGFVQNNAGLIACRVLIGIFESGFIPGSTYLMSMYYKRHELQRRLAVFWVSGLFAGAFGGLLAYGLVNMDGLGGYSGWRWIFIIEGLITIALVIPIWYLVADWPEEAQFLTAEERRYVLMRVSEDIGGGAKMDRLDRAAWRRILTDWKIWVASAMYLGITASGYSTALFVPSILKSLGYSGIESQVRSIPIWLVTASVTMASSTLSDRLKHRYGFIMFGVMFASIGYIMLICQGPPGAGLRTGVRYMAVFFVCVGNYIAQPVTLGWFANNLGGHYKRAVGLAMQIAIGNIGGIIASNIFVRRDAPRYFLGYGVALGMLLFCGIMASVFALGLTIENKKREQGKRDDRLLDESILANMGDDDPRFRFSL